MSKYPKITYACPDGHEFVMNALFADGVCTCTGLRCDGRFESCDKPLGPCRIDGLIPHFVKDGQIVFSEVRSFGPKKDRVKGAWMSEIVRGFRSIYISCGRCGTINDISDNYFYDNKSECFHCGECGCDHYILLEGFKEWPDVPRKPMAAGVQFTEGEVYTYKR